MNDIILKGVRVHNLKGVSLDIPRDQLIVITGLSGSGKSSLAFDTLYAEGQRRYVESLSVYARQFVSKMAKPEADLISGIPPAIAIEQRKFNRSPRSTVGTVTEIYDYLRMLYARVGHTFSPISGQEVKRHTTGDVLEYVNSLPEETKYMVSAPMTLPQGRTIREHLELQLANGFSRVLLKGEVERIQDLLQEPEKLPRNAKDLSLVIDRLVVQPDNDATNNRLGNSVETAFFEGQGTAQIVYGDEVATFSDRFELDGITFEEPSDKLFSFNSSVGACPTCEGYSQVLGIDEDLVIQNKNLSLYEECVMPWRGAKMSEWQKDFIRKTEKLDFPIHRPYRELTEEEKDLLWNGNGLPEIHGYSRDKIYGINDFFDHIKERQYKMHYRIMLARYRGRSVCPTCKGKRLRKEALYVQVGGKNISELVTLPISELREWLEALKLSDQDYKIGRRLLEELRYRVGFMDDIGLGYLTLDRVAGTLSGGEGQRIQLATSLGGGLIGTLYILDEPSIGLHARDTHLLIDIMHQLRDMGNTVVVVEHDEEVMRAADLIIDMGPEAGIGGGEVVFMGHPDKLPTRSKSYTVKYLQGKEQIPWPKQRRTSKSTITVEGAYLHNLKDIDVTIPLGVITVVTGVSGSGKSTLVREIFYEGVERLIDKAPLTKIPCRGIKGSISSIKAVEYVDQDSLGISTRSNPVTYIGVYDDIRRLMAAQQLSRQMGFTQQYFSFNTEGGRCETCKGEGVITIEMQFMADITIPCDECHGKRFNEEVLEVTFHDKNISDILELSIDEAIEFFGRYQDESLFIPKIVEGLQVLSDVGLGYIKLGQSSSTLSGGESQRVKLASHLKDKGKRPTLFIFDEPTTGLHVHDVHVLMKSFQALIDHGHTVVIVEHNMEVIKCADYIVDLGPEGGDKGGHLVYQGTPEGLMEVEESYTGHYLKQKYEQDHAQK
ncbi:excinuclease ABC subunit A [Chlamydia trachomatis]|nr:excinuclease ABC subunit A [Chlamydia trachomatis]